jgi:hypothetical protein
VEALVGKFTHIMLLHRPSLSVFSAVYAYARKMGHRSGRVWPSVLRELNMALAILPLVRADLSTPVAPVLLQTDASDTGAAVVYTETVAAVELARECRQPRTVPRDEGEAWSVPRALAPDFETSVDPLDWRVAVRQRVPAEVHINTKEASAVVSAVRWTARGRHGRRGCRLVVQSDSAVAVSAFRKGRSSKPGLLRQCRRLAATTLAARIVLVPRWVPTSRNMADRPSRGGRAPGPCDGPVRVRPRGRGQGGYAGVRVGEAERPGPVLAPFCWGTIRRKRAAFS